MFKVEGSGNKARVWYDFTIDELYWLLAYIPENDDFKKELWQGIELLEQAGAKPYKPAIVD
jgi:hypothetical protein